MNVFNKCLLTVPLVQSFCVQPQLIPPSSSYPLFVSRDDASCSLSRRDFVAAVIVTGLFGTAWLPHVALGANQEEETSSHPAPAVPPNITPCPRREGGRPANCVSTKNVKQVDLYGSPWTFEVSPDEAFERLKGAMVADGNLELVAADTEARYLKARVLRGLFTDELEFLVSEVDRVVTFRSAEVPPVGNGGGGEAGPSISDFGANRNRLESIRKKVGVFGIMGNGLTADSYFGDRGTGALGQLKAFYGLQSGAGYEDIFADQ